MKSRFGSDTKILLGYLLALCAAVSYGAAQTVGKHVTTEHAPPLVGTAFALMFGVLYISIMFSRHIPGDLKISSGRAIFFFGLSGLLSSSGVLFMYFALNQAPLVVISPVLAINPLITLTLAHIFLNRFEKITRRMIGGTLLVVFGVCIIGINGSIS